MKELREFLEDAELVHYYDSLHMQLRVNSVAQLKCIDDDELTKLGMTKPEVRRLRQFYKKECPTSALSKLKKILVKNAAEPGVSDVNNVPVCCCLVKEDCITVLRTLGIGEFGVIQHAVWTKDTGQQEAVAVKCIAKSKLVSEPTEFLREIENLSTVDHAHIVQLFGVASSNDSFMLLMELCSMRSVAECLRKPSAGRPMSVALMCDFAVQFADAMAYLENRRVVHRSLAARNVLVFAEDTVKVSDVGLMQAVGCGPDYYQSLLKSSLKSSSIAWLAPECLTAYSFTSSSDVWAFAVTLWEMFAGGAVPWSGLSADDILKATQSSQHLAQPSHCPDDYYQLMLRCWNLQPSERPKFSEMFLALLPQMKPARVCVTKACSSTDDSDWLSLKVGDVITVLSKNYESTDSSEATAWRGVIESTDCVGLFDSTFTVSCVVRSTTGRTAKVNRTESARLSLRPGRKLHAGLIGQPENDLRHIGHVGYDGVTFGDVSFIGEDYSKLQPVNTTTTSSSSRKREVREELTSSCISLPISRDKNMTSSTSAMLSGDDNDDDDRDVHLPDFSVGLDFGASLMEEVMKALNMSGAVSLPSNADVTVTSTDHADADDDIDSDDDTVSGGSDSDTASSTSTQTDDQQLDPDTDVDTYQQSTICDVICPPQSTAVISPAAGSTVSAASMSQGVGSRQLSAGSPVSPASMSQGVSSRQLSAGSSVSPAAGSTVSPASMSQGVGSRQLSAGNPVSPAAGSTVSPALMSQGVSSRQLSAGSSVSPGSVSQGVSSPQLSAGSPVSTLAETADSGMSACLPAQSPRLTLTDNNHIRLVSSNVRMPRGVPVPQRAVPPQDDTQTSVTPSDTNAADMGDTNPLRRLRNVGTFRPVTTSAQRYK